MCPQMACPRGCIITQVVLHPTKEGQFPRDPIFFGQTPVFLEGPWSGDSETVGEIEKGVRIFLREPFSQ